jgi:hypothetical protein
MTKNSLDQAPWPYASLLLFGIFGTDSPEGKRYLRRTTIALLLAGVGARTLHSPAFATRSIGATAIIGGVFAISWAFVRYMSELDELSRRIQLEALAIAYGCVMMLAFIWFALVSVGSQATAVSPAQAVGWLLMAEPLRGIALIHVAKRYR